MLIESRQTILVGVDLQPKLLGAMKHDPVPAATKLAKGAKILDIPAIFTEQYPKGLGNTVEPLKPYASNPIEKTCFSAARSPQFLKHIRLLKRSQFVLCGVEAHICILQTALDLLGQGDVFVAIGAISSISKRDYKIALRRMEQAGVKLVTTQMVLFEWLKDASHPNFKEIQKL